MPRTQRARPAAARSGLLRSSALISAGVLVSRATGFARTVVLVSVLGTTALADAYNFANNVPNIVYELVAGGVLAAVLLPLFVDLLQRRDRDGTSAVVSVAVTGLAALTVLGLLTAPALGWAIAAFRGGEQQAEQQQALTVLLRWFMPQVFFYGVMTVVTSLLQARRRFGAAAFAPAVNNLVTIAAYLLAPVISGVDLGTAGLGTAIADRWTFTVLGLGTTLGVVANAALLLPALRNERLGLRFRPTLRHPAIRRLGSASRGALGFVAVSQVGVIVTSLLANRYSDAGGYAAYTYASLFFYVAYGLLAVSITTALAPELASAAQEGDMARLRREWLRGLRLIVLLMAPASAGLVVLAWPLMRSLPLTAEGAELTAGILAWFATGLVAFSVYQYVVRSFYALSDTTTPFRLAMLQNSFIIGAAVVLAPTFGLLGLAASFVLGFWVVAVAGFSRFAHRIGRVPASRVAVLPRIVGASLAMAATSGAVVSLLEWGDRAPPAPAAAAAGLLAAAVAYPAYLWALRADGDLRALAAVLGRMVGR
ncbi:MAG: murein biosynthesis integral membrane protein MurJ [Acidimicrobiia bacterium]|nr:murein biosynthesis integral membrane protein MurJ [Acidimicrobiia bacterium]